MFEQLQTDLKSSMKAQDAFKTSVLRMFLSAIKYEQMEGAKTLESPTDEMVTKVLQREIKKRNEAVELYLQGGRSELADKEKSEIAILQAYLPEQMDEAALTSLVKDAIAETGATSVKQMGDVMKVLMPKVAGKADGKMISDLVRTILS